MSNWLPITEYSLKNGISISTIRRKIKNKTLESKIENGKYFILDALTDYEINENKTDADGLVTFAENSISTISKLNHELIEEKDKIIRTQEITINHLREQISDLKMLIGIMEKSN
ncbi:MAG: hypothetical protein WCQ53_00905 [bacterium]